MRIPKARYVTEDDMKIIPIRQMTKKKYVASYKGKLYCPTAHCPAKLSYCSSKKGHYKTWRYSNHSPDCQFNLEREGTRLTGSNTSNVAVNISKRHKQNALMRAYKTMVFNDAQLEGRVEDAAKVERNRSPRKVKSSTFQSAQMTLFGGAIDEDLARVKGKKLLSRFVHEIGPSDIGENRIIKGFIKDIEVAESAAEIIVGYQNEDITISFGENFKNDPLNKSYLNKFWALEEWLNRHKTVNFIGVGEVRLSKDHKYELVVEMGIDFKVDGEDLYNIARKMKVEVFN
ncbi:MAG TPA: hypothetical protein VNQ57_00305 [Ureibacillus sp.]|nr:hypothetical protein [Ureibacillus sp.]